MYNLSPNKYSDMIDSFIHGELDKAQENELIDSIKNNDELKNEYNDMQKIHNAVKSDTEAFSAPDSAYNNISKALNFTSNGKSSTGAESFYYFTKKYSLPIVAALLLAIFALYDFNSNPNNIINTNNSKANSQITTNSSNLAVYKSNQIHRSDIPFVKSYDNINSNNKQNKDNSSDCKNVRNYILNKIDNDNSSSLPDSPQENIINSNSDESNIQNNANDEKIKPNNLLNYDINYRNSAEKYPMNKMAESYSNSFQSLTGPKYDMYFSPIGKKSFSIALRGLVARNIPDNYSSPQVQGGLYNFAIGVYSNLSNNDKIKFGLEFGKEPFNQKFSKKDAQNADQNYEQNPVIFWGAVSMQFNLGSFDFAPRLNSFSRFMLGATELGPIAKALAGFDYKLSDTGINLMMGLEGSVLPYQNKSAWYSSQKLGFTFGISYDL